MLFCVTGTRRSGPFRPSYCCPYPFFDQVEKLRGENKQLTEAMATNLLELTQRVEKAVEEKDVFQRGYEQKSLKLDQTQMQHDAVSC